MSVWLLPDAGSLSFADGLFASAENQIIQIRAHDSIVKHADAAPPLLFLDGCIVPPFNWKNKERNS